MNNYLEINQTGTIAGKLVKCVDRSNENKCIHCAFFRSDCSHVRCIYNERFDNKTVIYIKIEQVKQEDK